MTDSKQLCAVCQDRYTISLLEITDTANNPIRFYCCSRCYTGTMQRLKYQKEEMLELLQPLVEPIVKSNEEPSALMTFLKKVIER